MALAADACLTAAACGYAEVTDEAVERAIQRGVAWLWSRQNDFGHWETGRSDKELHWAGDSALALLALLYAGENPHQERMDRALQWLAAQKLNGTYVYGIRAQALALVGGKKFAPGLQRDLDWLLEAVGPRGSSAAGAYDYVAPPRDQAPAVWDNSVTQFGVLGVWMAADAGLTVPEWYWEIVGRHWVKCQNPDGGWDYGKRGPGPSTGSMTAAGVSSLFVVLDQRYADRPKEAADILHAIEHGLDWLGREYGPVNPGGQAEWHYYYLYGVERVGRASGRKYLRDKEWFRTAAAYLLEQQEPDGHWTGHAPMSDLRNTALALMVLCHGRAPLLMNKLQHGPDWDRKLRDMAGLTRYAGHTFERLLNWQIVSLDGTLADLAEAPVLYMYGESQWEFSEAQVLKVREYCQRGGLVFGVAGKDSDLFCQGLESLAARAFPEFPRRMLATDHPLLGGEVQFPIDDPPPLVEVNNGVRTLMLWCPRDLAAAWSRYAVKGPQVRDFQLAANVYLYATDKTAVRSRLQTPDVAPRKVEIQRTIAVARIKYHGRWDPEPFGWTRLAALMNNQTATRLLVTSGVTLDSEDLKNFAIAHITGLERFELAADELRGLREFLSSGGTLIADAAGGAREFTAALEEHIRKATRTEPHVLPPDAAVLTGEDIPGAEDLSSVSYRRAARAAARGQKYPRLMAFATPERYRVLYSPLDLTVGLLGTQVYGIEGYDGEGAFKIMRNLLLYAALPATEKARLHRGTAAPDAQRPDGSGVRW